MYTLIHRLQTVSNVKMNTPVEWTDASGFFPEKYIFPYTKKQTCSLIFLLTQSNLL